MSVQGALTGLRANLREIHLRRAMPPLPRIGAFFLAYVVAAGFAQTMAITPGTGISIWAPSGLFMAMLTLTKRASWVWWVLTAIGAEFGANALWFHNSLGVTLLMSGGNALEAMAGAWLLRRVRPLHLVRLRQIIYLIVSGAVFAPIVSASIGAATLYIFQSQDFIHAWRLWWVGDATGVLVVAPIVLIAAKTGLRDWTPSARTIEIVILSAVFVGVAALTLSGRFPFAYLIIPPLLWAAIRFRFKGAAAALTALTLMTGAFTALGADAFSWAARAGGHKQLMLQLFLVVSALSTWLVAAVSHQQRLAVEALEAANKNLASLVDAKTARLAASELQAREVASEIEAIYDAAPVGLVLFDRELRFERINKRLAAINHRPASDHVGRLVEEVLPAATVEVLHKVLQRLEDGEETVEVELGGPDPETGAERHWLLSYQAVRHGTGEIVRLVGAVAEITARKHHEEQSAFIVREVSHRSKNLLTLISAVARQTLNGSVDERNGYERLEKRLRAIASNQDLLLHGAGRQGGVKLDELARSQLAHFAQLIDARIHLSGPQVEVKESAANAIAMALHELATNASKYGALSNEIGEVFLTWSATENGFSISWRERDGPTVTPPQHKGFGTQVVETMIARALSGQVTLSYAPSGVFWQLECPLVSAAVDPSTLTLSSTVGA